jgi:DNA-binding transcriptional ArsR family regulator
MSKNKSKPGEIPATKEDEIFKLLTHQTRRDIIKVLGERDLTFSQIKRKLELDSPALSYHLKSMKEFLIQKKSKYTFSELGRAALLLLTKTDQSFKMSRYKRDFIYAHIITGICWVIAGIFMPSIIGTIVAIDFSHSSINLIQWIIIISINIISVINMSVIGFLRNKYS